MCVLKCLNIEIHIKIKNQIFLFHLIIQECESVNSYLSKMLKFDRNQFDITVKFRYWHHCTVKWLFEINIRCRKSL